MSYPRLWRQGAWVVASGFGSGAVPVAPGTAGSLVGLAIGALYLGEAPCKLALWTVLATLAGFWAIPLATGQSLLGNKGAHDDPGWVVIDEIAGQMLALLGLHRISLAGLALAFALFRLFDILKPGPIGWADRQGGAIGIMADDLLAGGLAALILSGIHALRPP